MTTPVQHTVALSDLQPSKTNPRRHFDKGALEELTESVRKHGVLQPLLVRPVNGHMEIVAGERRYRAAKAAGLEDVPITVRDLDDGEVLELQLVENLLRRDLSALEESDGYQSLIRAGREVAWISERIGRSISYVYDRLKLQALIESVRELFEADRITAGHAILLARLAPKDQERAIGSYRKGQGHLGGGLFEAERVLWEPDDDTATERPQKCRSVRELAGWIDRNVRFDAEPDPMLFPEAAGTIQTAREEAEKIVSITHDYHVTPEAKDGSRIYGPRSWKRADGSEGSKLCDRSVTGVIVIGPARGEAFKICIDKKKCHAHWQAEQRAAKRRGKEATASGKKGPDRWELEQKKRREQEALVEAERARWGKALPQVLEAVAGAVKKAPTKASGLLGSIVLNAIDLNYGGLKNKAGQLVGSPKTADDVVRVAAMIALLREAKQWCAFRDFPKRARAFGVDVRKILDQVAPKEKPKASPAKAVQTSGKKRGRKAPARKTPRKKASKKRK